MFIISSEGKETEPRYFKAFAFESNKWRIKIVEKRFGTDPVSVVNAAINYKNENELRKDDKIWVVIDTDFSPEDRQEKEKELTNAGNSCKNNGFGYAVSNPCFEFWLLLHFEENPNISSTIKEQDKCLQLLKKHYPDYDKSTFNPQKFTGKVKEAVENAQKLDNDRDETWPRNHGSTVYKMVNCLLDEQK